MIIHIHTPSIDLLDTAGRGKDCMTDALRYWQNPACKYTLRMPAATRRATRDATNLLTAIPDEAAIIIALLNVCPEPVLSNHRCPCHEKKHVKARKNESVLRTAQKARVRGDHTIANFTRGCIIIT
jgi:hypothetical protein